VTVAWFKKTTLLLTVYITQHALLDCLYSERLGWLSLFVPKVRWTEKGQS
jgi:hypothetical protein